jgi:hypothetical protein
MPSPKLWGRLKGGEDHDRRYAPRVAEASYEMPCPRPLRSPQTGMRGSWACPTEAGVGHKLGRFAEKLLQLEGAIKSTLELKLSLKRIWRGLREDPQISWHCGRIGRIGQLSVPLLVIGIRPFRRVRRGILDVDELREGNEDRLLRDGSSNGMDVRLRGLGLADGPIHALSVQRVGLYGIALKVRLSRSGLTPSRHGLLTPRPSSIPRRASW